MHNTLSNANKIFTISQVYLHRNNSKSLNHYWIILVLDDFRGQTGHGFLTLAVSMPFLTNKITKFVDDFLNFQKLSESSIRHK